MRIHTVRLPKALAAKLESAAKKSRRTKTSFIVEAVERFLEDWEDKETALMRVRDPEAEWLSHEEVKRALDLD